MQIARVREWREIEEGKKRMLWKREKEMNEVPRSCMESEERSSNTFCALEND